MNNSTEENFYKRYEAEKNMWTNINSENIEQNSKSMYDLYSRLEASPILTLESSYDEKKTEVLDRFSDLCAFMLDVESIEILAKRNNASYDFLNISDNPFKMTKEDCEKVYQIDNQESLFESKARTIDCENKIAKMCMAQIYRVVEPDNNSRNESKENTVEESIKKIQQYVVLLDRLQGLNIKKNQELQNQDKLFTDNGYFNINKFLEQANNTSNLVELEETYGKIIKYAIDNDNNSITRDIKGMDCNINNFAKYATAKRLMSKLYEYKESDLSDLLNEYDLIKGTEGESKYLITSSKDEKLSNQNIDRVIHIIIQGYNQPFSIHVRQDSYKRYEKRIGEIPEDVIVPETTKSKVTFKLKEPSKSIISSVYKQNNEPKTIQYLEYLEKLQDIESRREKIRNEKIKYQKIEQEKRKKEMAEQKQNARVISGINKKIRKYTSKIQQLEKKSVEQHLDINKIPFGKREQYGTNRVGRAKKRIKKQKSIKEIALQKVNEAEKMAKQLEELRKQKSELEKQLRELQKEKSKTKDD